jgi:HEAT repeat protein
VRDGVVSALAGRSNPLATDALIELSADRDPAIRDWATFAIGALATQDSPALRDALAARLEDADPEARIEAVHGLALRGDARAVEPALTLLGSGEPGGSLWTRHALQEAAIRLAAMTGDPRFAPHLPALDDGWRGTTLERELERALERCAGR